MDNRALIVSKVGSDHLYVGKNKQDFAFAMPGIKVVLDGCGSTSFPEVGVTLFAQLLASYQLKYELTEDNFVETVDKIFDKMINIVPLSDEFLINNLCFTILICFETDDEFTVLACGDGYILTQKNGEIEIIELDDGEYPKYYAYNYVNDKNTLNTYAGGVGFTPYYFSKDAYDNVGVATDGFQYAENLDWSDKTNFFSMLSEGKSGKIAILINKNISIFKDDISICF